MVEEGCEDFVAGFEGAGEGAGDFGGADAFAISDRDFTDSDSEFRGFELHFDCPAEGFVLHVETQQVCVSDGAGRGLSPYNAPRKSVVSGNRRANCRNVLAGSNASFASPCVLAPMTSAALPLRIGCRRCGRSVG